MSNKIEIMDKKRKRLLIFLMIGYGVWHGMFLLYGIIEGIFWSLRRRPNTVHAFLEKIGPYYLYFGLFVFLIFIFFLVKWWLFKKSLKKDPALQSAVNDELVKQNWLKSYRFSFFCTTGLLVFLHIVRIYDSFIAHGRLGIIEGLGLHYLLYTAVMSCLGAFLHYNKGN